jgi:hypothetical protein
MSKTTHLRHDLKVKTYSIPPAGLDPLKLDDAAVLAHGFIPRPTWHPKLSALWERAAKGITSIAEPRLQLREHGVLRGVHPQSSGPLGSSGADLNALSGAKFGWVAANFQIPNLNPPGSGSGPTGAGESIIMGVSLDRNTGSILYAGVYWNSANESSLSDPTFELFLQYQTGSQVIYSVAIDTTPVRITSGTQMYLYLSVSTSPDDSGSTWNEANLLYQAGGQISTIQHSLSLSSGVPPFTGATDAAWTVEDLSLLPDYGEVDFQGASAGFCSPANASSEPSPSDAWNDGTLSTGSVAGGTVTCRYHSGG